MVEIHISGVHYQVTSKVRSYVTDKLMTLNKYHAGLGKVHVTIHPQEKHGFRVDLDMHLPHGRDVVAHDSQETIYSAIDLAHDKAVAQLRKIHEKEVRHRNVA